MQWGKFQLFRLLDRQKMAFWHLKGKPTLLEKMKLTVFDKVLKDAHFTDFFLHACSMYIYFEFKLQKHNTIFMVPEIQTINNDFLNLISQVSFLLNNSLF